MSLKEMNIMKNIISILAQEALITSDEQVRMLEMLKRNDRNERQTDSGSCSMQMQHG